jgi:hypothetical protein
MMLRMAGLLAVLLVVSCVSVSVADFKEEPEFLYGKGAGKTQGDAEKAARMDLVSQAFAGSREVSTESEGAFVFTAEMRKSVKLPTLKPFILDKSKTEVAIVYRLPKREWAALERNRQAEIRTDVGNAFNSLRGAGNKDLEWRIAEAGRLLDRLSLEGVSGVLTETESSPSLMYRAIESYCREQVSGARFGVEPASGLIDDGSSFEITLSSKDGRALPATPISIAWKTAGGESLGKATTTTDSSGMATVAFPKGEGLAGARSLRLALSTTFSPRAPEVPVFKALDAETARDFAYFHFDDLKKAFLNEASIPGGAFTAGAVKQDRRALRKEAPRETTVGSFSIDRNLVSNALYGAFLADTGAPRSAYPAYWENSDYNGPGQPVIGVSLEDAKVFAAWVSERLGCKKRLPTADEWEKAARGGAETIYPWGDQSPTDSIRANYDGNGRFDGTSPVGSFENGKNAYGLYDMAGNVWEWTSSPSGNPDSPGAAIVKGGSWMDGPNDLRVSNWRDLDPAKSYSDVGFRLVREVSND